VGPPDSIAMGSPTVIVAGQMAARQTDPTVHGGLISVGLPNVLIGVPGTGSITINGMAVTRLPNGSYKVGNAITINGTPDFTAAVIGRLAMIANTPAGRTMLSTIDGSGRTMTIIAFAGPNSSCDPSPNSGANLAAKSPAGMPVFWGNGAPVMNPDGTQMVGTGTGSNVTMQLNPNLTLPNALDPANPMPNDAVAFHEMSHGSRQMTGTSDTTPLPGTGWTSREEQTAIRTGAPSEADYLRQSGYPYQRTGHNTTFAPNP
jgi:hypothetical protein